MKINKTLVFATLTLAAAFYVYVYEYKKEDSIENVDKTRIIDFDVTQISYFQIVKSNTKIALQKDETGWTLLEPIHENADNAVVEEMLQSLGSEKLSATVKNSENSFSENELSEYGLDKPILIFNFKNNLGVTKKVAVGSVKNYEGKSYLQIDSQSRVVLGSNTWFNKANDELIFYRDKRLFRENMANVNKIKIQTLQDKFELKRTDNKWRSVDHSFEIDQNKVREILKKISDSGIEDYVFEGEPSQKLLKEKEIDKSQVKIELITDGGSWSALLNINEKDKALYLLSDRPTYLAKVNPVIWEAFATLTLDGLRDRISAFSFAVDEVKKIYFKQNDKETNLIFNAGSWLVGSSTSPYFEVDRNEVNKILKKIHDFKISEFIDYNAKDKFIGNNMLILKSDTEKLVLQLNWGPAIKIKKGEIEKDYFYARTHLSSNIFAIEKSIIDILEVESNNLVKKNKVEQVEPPSENLEK